MMTVAKTIDAPVKFVARNPPTAAFPFALLGLGDVAIPAILVRLMFEFDRSRTSKATGRLLSLRMPLASELPFMRASTSVLDNPLSSTSFQLRSVPLCSLPHLAARSRSFSTSALTRSRGIQP